MSDDEKKNPAEPREEEPKSKEFAKRPIKFVDTTDQMPEGFGIMIIGGVCEHQMKDRARKADTEKQKEGKEG